jgi:hypothetical protein
LKFGVLIIIIVIPPGAFADFLALGAAVRHLGMIDASPGSLAVASEQVERPPAKHLLSRKFMAGKAAQSRSKPISQWRVARKPELTIIRVRMVTTMGMACRRRK